MERLDLFSMGPIRGEVKIQIQIFLDKIGKISPGIINRTIVQDFDSLVAGNATL